MRTSLDLASASMGTGTTKTEVGNSPYTLDEDINELYTFTPRQAETAAYTAGEAVKTVVFLESPDIKLDPVRYAMAGIVGGLGVSPVAIIPALEEIPIYIPCKPGQRIRGWGQEMTANTVAPRLGISFDVGSVKSGKPQIYWDVSGSDTPAVTALGTAAARVQMTNITVQDMKRIVRAYARVYPTVVTASQDYIAFLEWICTGFRSAAPFEHGTQPMASNLGTAVGVGLPSDFQRMCDREFKSNAQQTVQNWINVEEALTGNGSGIGGVGMTKV
jgi:hypothetical protein